MTHAKYLTKDDMKNPEYHVVASITTLRTNKNPWPNHVENLQHIGSKKTCSPKNAGQSKHKDAKDFKRKWHSGHACFLICQLSKTEKYTAYDRFRGNGPYGEIPTKATLPLNNITTKTTKTHEINTYCSPNAIVT